VNEPPLGRLEQVALRSIWADEAGNFTPWLAKPENLKLLVETLGVDLEPESEEVAVGPFLGGYRLSRYSKRQQSGD